MSKNKFNSGFTLVELLVVMTIIGVLSTLGLSAFVSSQTKSRDVKRQSDIKSIMRAVEQMYAENTNYPSYSGDCSLMPNLSAYFPQGIPTDPKSGLGYDCNSGVGSTAFCVTTANIENDYNANCEESCVACSGACNTETNAYYCAWSQAE